MNADWIRFRTGLPKDPQVLRMAAYLEQQEEYKQWRGGDVTRDVTVHNAYVTVCVAVTSLLLIWGVVRERGVEDGEDYTLNHSDLSTLDGIANVPCIGAAMADVGWVSVEKGLLLRFPKFKKNNTSKAAQRQREYRKREKGKEKEKEKEKEKTQANSDVTGDVTSDVTGDVTGDASVTHRVEESRGEKSKEESKSQSLADDTPVGIVIELGLPDARATYSWMGHLKKKYGAKVVDEVAEKMLAKGRMAKDYQNGEEGFRSYFTKAVMEISAEITELEAGADERECRAILDRCARVHEAQAILKKYPKMRPKTASLRAVGVYPEGP